MSSPNDFTQYFPPHIQSLIEDRYLNVINEKAKMGQVVKDPHFYADAENYPPFFSDHGVVHHRDVASQLLAVLDQINGILISERGQERLEIMKGYGVLVAFLHDVGMSDFTEFGRSVHPEAASHVIFSQDFDPIFNEIWDQDCGDLPSLLKRYDREGSLEQNPKTVLREMLSMVTCHSKSKVPVSVLSDAHQLRSAMQGFVGKSLRELYLIRQVQKAQQELVLSRAWQDTKAIERSAMRLNKVKTELAQIQAKGSNGGLRRVKGMYHDFERDSYRWLVSTNQDIQFFVSDVIDTLRVLRCADALRQRGTTLKTSGGYEVFVDQKTANAIYALRFGEDELYLMEITNVISAGEANIHSSQIDANGDLRISFHRGSFQDQQTNLQAAYYAAVVVNDIQADAIESFLHPDKSGVNSPPKKSADDMQILLEGVDDNIDFADRVRDSLVEINPQVANRTRTVPSLQNASELELSRYLNADDFDWDLSARIELLEKIGQTGHKIEGINHDTGFDGVKQIRLNAGDILLEAGASSSFVYIPLSPGLRIIPLGGYDSFPVNPWMPLGITGVIRGATRNATISADADVSLVMIPKSVYLQHWHTTYSVSEFLDKFRE